MSSLSGKSESTYCAVLCSAVFLCEVCASGAWSP